ncbi:MAG: RagB/SusD family nutrient uptake outer membrane protein [Mangrovibacterium sp.]
MKQSVLYILVSLTVLTSSCADFLEVESPSKSTEATVFASEAEIVNAVYGIYSNMVGAYLWLGQWTQNLNVNTDVEFYPVTSSVILDEKNFMPSPNTVAYNNIWNALYDGINRANDVIQGIENSDLYKAASTSRPSSISHYLGEAKALRAMYYLELVRNWGDVPYRRNPSGDKKELYIGAADRDTILSDMIKDLIQAEPMMLYADETQVGCEGASREFCQALIARIALTRGGWSLRPDHDNPGAIGTMRRSSDWEDFYEIAETYAGKVITEGRHSLNIGFEQMWINECNWTVPKNDDIIFDVPAKVGGTGEYGYWAAMPMDNPEASAPNPNAHAYGYSQGALSMTPLYMLSFDAADLRRNFSCAMYKYDAGLNQIANVRRTTVSNAKWCRLYMKSPLGRGSNKGSGINYPYMRYADVLLMYAEAANENNNGPTSEARKALAEVRKRAFAAVDHSTKVNQYIENLSTKEDFFNAIVKERAWEFGGEKHRRYDLARWNLYSRTIYDMYHALIAIGLATNKVAGADPAYANYPANVYYKQIDNPDTGSPIKKLIVWEGLYENVASAPAGYTSTSFMRTYATRTGSNTEEDPYVWNPGDFIKYSFWGYINEMNKGSINPETNPVRYLMPIPAQAIYSHKGTLKNYYGF